MKNYKRTFFVEKWYSNYFFDHYKNKEVVRDSLLNKEVLFQYLARKKCLINSICKLSLKKEVSKIIDIGCGSCSDLINLVSFGFNQKNLYGVDLNKSDVNFGRKNYPLLNISNQNATQLNFENDCFDLTMESTMFVQITNLKISQEIANEMIRITKKKGFILLMDWRYGKFKDKKFLACHKRRVREIFKVGDKTSLISIIPGMLVPPIGRFCSKHCSWLYFPIAKLFPFIVGQVGYILIKN